MAKTLDPTGKLTDKQALFVREYTVDFNASAAAIRAGYSAATAYSIGQENLTKPHIDTAIRTLMAERAQKLDITGERVLQGFAEIAFANVMDFLEVGPDGLAPADFTKLDRRQTGAIARVTSQRSRSGGVVQFQLRMENKVAALTALAKYLNILGGKLERDSPRVEVIFT